MINKNNKNKEILMTEEGLKELQKELKKLTEVERSKVLDELQQARSLGDLSENGMYSAAREKQSFIEGRIRELEDILKNAKVSKGNKSNVGMGNKVILETQQKEVEYHIVGAEEVNHEENKISHQSPLGEALMGKKVGDTVNVEAPAGVVQYKVIGIK